MKHYMINEVYRSIQGEGMRAGTANVFVRFTGCNMRCEQEPGDKSPGGFDCDTEFESGRKLTATELVHEIEAVRGAVNWLILTGGEPLLQYDVDLFAEFRKAGYFVAIETNGSIEVPLRNHSLPNRDDLGVNIRLQQYAADWITVSPKVAEHCVRQPVAHELKYVRGHGQALPKPTCEGLHKLISPAFEGMNVSQRTMAWCQKLITEDPTWRLSLQMHKLWMVR